MAEAKFKEGEPVQTFTKQTAVVTKVREQGSTWMYEVRFDFNKALGTFHEVHLTKAGAKPHGVKA